MQIKNLQNMYKANNNKQLSNDNFRNEVNSSSNRICTKRQTKEKWQTYDSKIGEGEKKRMEPIRKQNEAQ